MITNATLAFLRELKGHNERTWFTEHKSDYQQAYSEMLDTVIQLLVVISGFDKNIARQLAKNARKKKNLPIFDK